MQKKRILKNSAATPPRWLLSTAGLEGSITLVVAAPSSNGGLPRAWILFGRIFEVMVHHAFLHGNVPQK